VPNKKLNFVGYSNSQLKNLQCWFSSLEANIVNELSTIDEPRVLKRYARIGQLFTTTSSIDCTIRPE